MKSILGIYMYIIWCWETARLDSFLLNLDPSYLLSDLETDGALFQKRSVTTIKRRAQQTAEKQTLLIKYKLKTCNTSRITYF